jgi:hypothetical protein
MTEGDGLSFAELTYTLMQGWDWWELNKQMGIQMQIGGSDQYGNIVTGIDAVKTVRESMVKAQPGKWESSFEADPVGFTVPLLTNSAGEKIGKSSGGGNLWLDNFQTSPYDLYGYFVRQPDEDVERMLKLLTFIPEKDISLLMQEDEAENHGAAHGSLMAAIRTILIADLVMSLDNVIAVAAAANGNMVLLITGLALSIPLVIFGSTLLLKVIEKLPVLVWFGAALLGFIAGELLVDDPALTFGIGELEANIHLSHHNLAILCGAVGALIVVAAGKLINLRNQRAEGAA